MVQWKMVTKVNEANWVAIIVELISSGNNNKGSGLFDCWKWL
jgi:hypothetical protein